MDPKSDWYRIDKIVNSLPGDDDLECLSDLDNPELTALCHKMLEILKGLDKGEG
jgi:hypothetical protein